MQHMRDRGRALTLEAKKTDMEQGMAQCLVGCEAVSDKDKCNIVYGIVSSYFQWGLFEKQKRSDLFL